MHEEKHILVVDDTASIRSLLSILLQSEGYVVHQAATAMQGLDLLRSQPIDMVTLDLGLPDMDGLDMLESMKQTRPDLPVTILSVRNDTLTKKTAFALGVEHYLTKPFEIQEVLEVVHDSLGAEAIT